MSSICPICVKVDFDPEEGVGCDGACERWFHRECVKMSKTEDQHMCGDNNIKWTCNRADCNRTTADPIHSKLDKILSRLSSLATKEELTDGLKLIKQDFDKVTAKLEELESRLALVESEVLSLKNDQFPMLVISLKMFFPNIMIVTVVPVMSPIIISLNLVLLILRLLQKLTMPN